MLDIVGSCDVIVECLNFLEVLDCLVCGMEVVVDLLFVFLLMGVVSLFIIWLMLFCGRDL